MRVTDTLKLTIVASTFENAEVKAATLKIVDLLDIDLENSGFVISDDVEEALDTLDDLLEPEEAEEKVEEADEEDDDDDSTVVEEVDEDLEDEDE